MLGVSSNINKNSNIHARYMQLYSEKLSEAAVRKWRMQSMTKFSPGLCITFFMDD